MSGKPFCLEAAKRGEKVQCVIDYNNHWEDVHFKRQILNWGR